MLSGKMSEWGGGGEGKIDNLKTNMTAIVNKAYSPVAGLAVHDTSKDLRCSKPRKQKQPFCRMLAKQEQSNRTKHGANTFYYFISKVNQSCKNGHSKINPQTRLTPLGGSRFVTRGYLIALALSN